MTCYQEIACPDCGSHQVVKAGYSASGERRYRCCHSDCPTKSFMLTYRYKAYQPGIKAQVVDMAINSSGIRDTWYCQRHGDQHLKKKRQGSPK
jgi:transposase-like protein